MMGFRALEYANANQGEGFQILPNQLIQRADNKNNREYRFIERYPNRFYLKLLN